MKDFLMLSVLCVTASAQLFIPNCSDKEVSSTLLWPYYEDKRFYYECRSIGEPVLVECSRVGDVFIYVYQTCAAEEYYQPPPAVGNLPTEFPPTISNTTPSTTPKVTAADTTVKPPFTLPTPQHPQITTPSDVETTPVEEFEPTSVTDPTTQDESSTASNSSAPPLVGPPSPPATGLPSPTTGPPTPPTPRTTLQLRPPTPPARSLWQLLHSL